jgi:iron(III) transport system permease protein
VTAEAASRYPQAVRRSPRWWPLSGRAVCYVVVFLMTLALVVAPLVMLLLTSLNLGPIAEPGLGPPWLNYATAWTSSTTYATLANTFVFALGATSVAVVLGVFFAFMVERTDMPFRTFAYVAITSTLAMPGMLYGSRGCFYSALGSACSTSPSCGCSARSTDS